MTFLFLFYTLIAGATVAFVGVLGGGGVGVVGVGVGVVVDTLRS